MGVFLPGPEPVVKDDRLGVETPGSLVIFVRD